MALDVLVVEDDQALRDVLAFHLRAEGFDVRTAGDGNAALEVCAAQLPDVVVLDVMLPGRSGLEVCAALRALYHPSPGVVMVTARDGELDVILGLEVGADDYVIKPCRPREVVARVRALARRLGRATTTTTTKAATPVAGAATASVRLKHGALEIDAAMRRAAVGAELVKLTPSEFELLLFLARNPARVHSRLELLAEVFGSTNEGYARNVDSHVMRIRKKLEAAGLSPAPIKTVHGSGYAFEP